MDGIAKEAGHGADRWCRTGVIVLEHGGEKVEKKMCFRRMPQLLQDHYNNKNISYGTVVLLSIARNKRNKSAKRFAGVASITSRKCQKGLQLRLNPDEHWSNAIYSPLDVLQLKDGKGLELTNRDNVAAFRLDTMCTHNQYKTLVSEGRADLTSYTDFVSKYPARLQTTSYCFPSTETTLKKAAGIVKAVGLFEKNPSQHAADYEMLTNKRCLGMPSLKVISSNLSSVSSGRWCN